MKLTSKHDKAKQSISFQEQVIHNTYKLIRNLSSYLFHFLVKLHSKTLEILAGMHDFIHAYTHTL
jgi:hypothetical protein